MTATFSPGSKLFIDTGAFIALANAADRMHGGAASFYRSVPPRVPRLTTAAVLGETYTFLRYHLGRVPALRWLDGIEDAVATGHLKVIYPDAAADKATRDTLRRYPDQDLSYTDALTLVVLDMESVEYVFGFDHHLALTGRVLVPGPS
ncbi:type II toxin-antitoxin system VapC family toxin [Caldinitratiruptor microaerophilus]|uniref:PIN domain-containing protein n=1 Tax=Caldinitratiruptor microaerophilus TaxID=671077 RepID=A0AA35CPF5_9FIRM|nr:hypothetical protein [Caldinitratiruptor microaerophilus]BDG61315.1 hypothetical protein caldi_24050 [Caldinitratiruptor microaerophilus]